MSSISHICQLLHFFSLFHSDFRITYYSIICLCVILSTIWPLTLQWFLSYNNTHQRIRVHSIPRKFSSQPVFTSMVLLQLIPTKSSPHPIVTIYDIPTVTTYFHSNSPNKIIPSSWNKCPSIKKSICKTSRNRALIF